MGVSPVFPASFSKCESWLEPDKTALPVAIVLAVKLKPAHQTSSVRLAASQPACLKVSSSQDGTDAYTPSPQLNYHRWNHSPMTTCLPPRTIVKLLSTSPVNTLMISLSSDYVNSGLGSSEFGLEPTGKVRSVRVNHRLLDAAGTLESCIGPSQHFTAVETDIQVPKLWYLDCGMTTFCLGPNGFLECETCSAQTGKVLDKAGQVDHSACLGAPNSSASLGKSDLRKP
ncbi:uncharacterized protein [Physeter macrocephalus]|nr:uncharacterized protein LOC102992546 isoform X2 [Physeter catodon]|eukprot:XP_028335283.1 uncharacterized protein LOC102992546 isoform X2 [Physeter catodon]